MYDSNETALTIALTAPPPTEHQVPAIEWVKSGTMIRSRGGRFDLFFSERSALWVAIDWNEGVKVHGDLVGCKDWCAKRVRS